jgi:hypothetical protein
MVGAMMNFARDICDGQHIQNRDAELPQNKRHRGRVKKRAEKAFVASWEKDIQKKAMHMQRMSERNEQLERIRRRYAGRGKEGKSHLLDEFCEQYGYERKYAIKLLQVQTELRASKPRPGPEPRYEPVQEVVERIWNCAEHLCGKRLVPALELWLPHYARHNGQLLPTQKKLLGSISAATLDRLLSDCKARAHRARTAPGRAACCAIRYRSKGRSGMSNEWVFSKQIVWLIAAAVWQEILSALVRYPRC